MHADIIRACLIFNRWNFLMVLTSVSKKGVKSFSACQNMRNSSTYTFTNNATSHQHLTKQQSDQQGMARVSVAVHLILILQDIRYLVGILGLNPWNTGGIRGRES